MTKTCEHADQTHLPTASRQLTDPDHDVVSTAWGTWAVKCRATGVWWEANSVAGARVSARAATLRARRALGIGVSA